MGKAFQLISIAAAIGLLLSPGMPATAKSKAAPKAPVDDSGCATANAEAASLFSRGHNLEAAGLLRKWTNRCPNNCQMHLLLSTILLRQGAQQAEAADEAAKAVAANPQLVAAHLQYGLALMANGKTLQSSRAFEKVVELDPNNYEAWSSLAGLYSELHQDDKASESAARAADLEPGSKLARERALQNAQQAPKAPDANAIQQIIDGVEPSP